MDAKSGVDLSIVCQPPVPRTVGAVPTGTARVRPGAVRHVGQSTYYRIIGWHHQDHGHVNGAGRALPVHGVDGPAVGGGA